MVRDLKEFINTKNDIYGLKTKWPGDVLNYLKTEHEKSFIWQEKAVLNKKTDGKEDETHKIEKKGDKYVQCEKVINPKADIYAKLQFSEAELLGLIKKIELNIL